MTFFAISIKEYTVLTQSKRGSVVPKHIWLGPCFALSTFMYFTVKKLLFLNLFAALQFALFSSSAFAHTTHLECQDLFTRAQFSTKETLGFDHVLQVQTYLDDTVNSLNQMRGENGLVNDTIWIENKDDGAHTIRAVQSDTSPTNIASDLLVQTELLIRSGDKAAGLNLSRILNTLKTLARHTDSGLFFSWYSTHQTSTVSNYAISSIDNMHLAIALWTIKETFPGTELARQAEELFSPMDFSMYYDVPTGLIHGNFAFNEGTWTRDAYNFANIGSEARILYTAGWALGLFKNYSHHSDFVTRACKALECEILKTDQGMLLRLWTGSAFQLFFPKMFVGEQSFSAALKKIYERDGNYMVAEGLRRGLPLPAGCSPCVIGLAEEKDKVYSLYNANAGNIGLVSTDNRDVQNPAATMTWESAVTPNALVMAATSNIAEFLPLLKQSENLKSGNNPLYMPGMGWADAINVSGPLAGNVVPTQVAVNQAVIAMSLLQMLSSDGLSASARAFLKNPTVHKDLNLAYQIVDGKLVESEPK